MRGPDPQNIGADGLLKGIYRRYYRKGHVPVPGNDLEEEEYHPSGGSTRRRSTLDPPGGRQPGEYAYPQLPGSRSSLALAQNEGVITWTHVMADRRVLTLENLIAMSPIVNGVDLVSRACRQLFLSHVKSQTNVRDTFFPEHEPDR